MNDIEMLCFPLAFLVGIAGGWELGGYRWVRQALDWLRGRK
jgi:hypothetical protein